MELNQNEKSYIHWALRNLRDRLGLDEDAHQASVEALLTRLESE